MIRAARVAIDIGVHLELPIPDDVTFHPGERWTFEIAHELLTSRGFMIENAATSEVLRYMGWPGQAISYKVGEKAILDLRSEWIASGTADLKSFHSTVLGAARLASTCFESTSRPISPCESLRRALQSDDWVPKTHHAMFHEDDRRESTGSARPSSDCRRSPGIVVWVGER